MNKKLIIPFVATFLLTGCVVNLAWKSNQTNVSGDDNATARFMGNESIPADSLLDDLGENAKALSSMYKVNSTSLLKGRPELAETDPKTPWWKKLCWWCDEGPPPDTDWQPVLNSEGLTDEQADEIMEEISGE